VRTHIAGYKTHLFAEETAGEQGILRRFTFRPRMKKAANCFGHSVEGTAESGPLRKPSHPMEALLACRVF
jgi:hypothetical protein